MPPVVPGRHQRPLPGARTARSQTLWTLTISARVTSCAGSLATTHITVLYAPAMQKPLGLAACPFVALTLLVSGCGSTTSTTTTLATNTSAGTTGAQTAPQSTAGSTATPHTTQASPPKTAEAKSKGAHTVAKASPAPVRTVSKPSVKPAKPPLPPGKGPYPAEIKQPFLETCRAAKGSTSSCVCVLTSLERSHVEQGESIAELIVLETKLRSVPLAQVLRGDVRLPSGDEEAAIHCKNV